MTTTLKNLIDDAQLNIQGFTYRQDRATYLTQACTSGDLVLSVGSTDNIGKGIIEIDSEMMWVDSYDRQANTITIAPFGRGYNSTTAAAHSANAKVTITPTYPRVAVQRAINDTINSVYPKVFAVGSTDVTFLASRTTYQVPSEAIQILHMAWQTVGPTREWLPIRQWRWDPLADQSYWGVQSPDGPSSGFSRTVSVYDNILPGRTMHIVYSKQPVNLVNETDNFESVSGLPSSMRDVIIYGATYRLSSFMEPARTSITSAAADEFETKRPYGSNINVTKQLQQMYQMRLEEESLKQKLQFPARVHYSR
jgi:hypothetical protein